MAEACSPFAKRSRDRGVPRFVGDQCGLNVPRFFEEYPAMYLDNTSSLDSRATTRGKRDVQRERDYKHKKGIR